MTSRWWGRSRSTRPLPIEPDGEALFASLALPPRADSKLLIERLPGKLGPKLDRSGPFAQPKQLTELIQNAGQQSWVLLAHFLWPHGLAALGDQGSPPSGSMGSGRVDLDRPHHRLVIRP